MSKKQSSKKAGKTEIALTAAESQELEIVLDRLSVQNPAGESFKNLLKSMRSTLAERENLVAALIDEIGKNPSDAGFQAFLALRDLLRSKHYRRMVKQTAYRLAQRGYTAPDEQGEPAEKVVVLPKEVRPAVAHFVPADDNLWFVSALIPDSTFHPEPVAVAVFPENRFQRLNVREVEASPKKYKELLQIVSGQHAKPCEIPVWHAAGLVNEMIGFCREQSVSFETKRVLRFLEPYHDPGKRPYVYELMPAGDEHPVAVSEEESRQLLQAVNVSALYFKKEDLAPYRERVQGVERSVLSVPREVQEERMFDIMRQATNELCVGKMRLLCERFFEEQAMWLKLSSMNDLADLAWKTACHLKSVENAGDDYVALSLVIVSVTRHWPEDFEDPPQKSSERFRETDSGLILPR
jgi:hypothetical protein